jgi:orotidine-5'-phosphate decarboxylase
VFAVVELGAPVGLVVRGTLLVVLDLMVLFLLAVLATWLTRGVVERPGWLPDRGAFRTRIAAALGAFFIVPAVGFATINIVEIAQDGLLRRDLMIAQTLRDASPGLTIPLTQGVRAEGGEVFLDLKYHDIPNTVAMAGVEACRLGARMFNVHALGGREMMAKTVAEVDARYPRGSNERPLLLAVTILTSSTEATLREVGIERPVREMVLRLARLAQEAGMDGVVASPQEVGLIREACGADFAIVTPGVRPASAALDDQKRVMTPGEAIAAGADFLVIGRPISAAVEPVAAAESILAEMALALGQA